MVQILRLFGVLALLSVSLPAQNIHWAQILSGDRQGAGTKGMSNALTSAHFFVGNGSNVATDVAISGDASVTNAGVWTNVKLNGVSFAASPSTNTVPIITASNTATYTSVPDCQDSAGNHLNYNNTTHALSCGTTGSATGSIHSIGATFDGGGSALTTGTKVYVTVPYACTINAWNMTVDTGTATIDAWKIATGTAIPTVTNTITASATPAISTGTAIHSTTLTAWTTSVTANDIFAFNISAVSSATKASLALQCQ